MNDERSVNESILEDENDRDSIYLSIDIVKINLYRFKLSKLFKSLQKLFLLIYIKQWHSI